MRKFTVFGGRGFIGSEFVKELKIQGHDVFVPERGDLSIYEDDLGTVIYSAGYGDCQKDPFNVLHANVILLSSLLEKAKFNKLVYISSTRIYMNQYDSFESCDLKVSFDDNRKLFNLTKLVSEELCLKSNRDCLVIRPSNVYGLAINSPLFLPSITRNAVNDGKIDMFVPRTYEKDYISVRDVVQATIGVIGLGVTNEIVNVASGINTKAEDIANIIQGVTQCKVIWHDVNQKEFFPPTDVSLMTSLVDFKPSNVLDDLSLMVGEFMSLKEK